MTSEIPQAAQAAHDRAGECIQERRFVDSIVHAETAVRLCPDWAAPWWNLTVGYKHARRWADALEACDRAIALAPNDAEGPHWNAGIAATALGRWDRARAAWAASGIKLPAGEGPIDMNIGPTPIRISPDDKPEVVWCARIDPCRARIRSVPLPDSGRRHDDLLLHDGEARGRRRHGEVTVPVFDELEVLEASTYATWEVTIRCPDRAELEELLAELEETELRAEDWTGNMEFLCKACSLGEPHDHDDRPRPEPPWKPERRLGVAVRSEDDLRPLRRARFWWRRGVVSVRRVL